MVTLKVEEQLVVVMKIPADMLGRLAQDSDFFAHMMGCSDVTDCAVGSDGGLDALESDPDPDNAEAVTLLSEEEQMAAMAYYFMNHTNMERRCFLLHKLGLPCVSEVRTLFESKRLDAGLDIPHFMAQFAVDVRGHITDSPWGVWFVHWCAGAECNTHKSLMQRMGHAVERFCGYSMVMGLILSGDFVAARHYLRISEDYAKIRGYLMSPNQGLQVHTMNVQRARRIIDFLLTEWVYLNVLTDPSADVAELVSDFWFNNHSRLEADDRFLPELLQLMAQERYRVTGKSIQLCITRRQPGCLAAQMQHGSTARLSRNEIVKSLYNGLRHRADRRVPVMGVLQCVYAARPAALIKLARTVGEHVTPEFCSWMEANTTMSHAKLSVLYLNSRIVKAHYTRINSQTLVDLYRATVNRDGTSLRTAMDGVIALHDALSKRFSEDVYHNGRRNGFISMPDLNNCEKDMTLDELQHSRGADFEPSLSMFFWLRPLTESESAWLRLFGISMKYQSSMQLRGPIRTMIAISRMWHIPLQSYIGCIADFTDQQLTAMGVCPPRIIALFLLREFRDRYNNNPVARLHALGLIAEEDQPGLVGLLVALPAR